MRYKKSEISVSHIVEAAMRVLARQGYAHSSLMDIANEVGMSKGAVHYLPNQRGFDRRCSGPRARRSPSARAKPGPTATTCWSPCVPRSTNCGTCTPSSRTRSRWSRTSWRSVCTTRSGEPWPRTTAWRFRRWKITCAPTPRRWACTPRSNITSCHGSHALLDGLLLQRIFDPEAINDEQVIHALETIAASLFVFGPKPAADVPAVPSPSET